MAVPQTPTTTLAVTASLYVGDLHPYTTDTELYEAFNNENRTVASVRVCRDTTTGRSLCYGYVNFVNTDDGTVFPFPFFCQLSTLLALRDETKGNWNL